MQSIPKRMFPEGLKTRSRYNVPLPDGSRAPFDNLETTLIQKNRLLRNKPKRRKLTGMIEKSYYNRETGKVETVLIREERSEKIDARGSHFWNKHAKVC